MLEDLDRTLKALLEAGLRSDLRKKVAITFAAADDTYPPEDVSLPAINLFLYDVRENRDLRSNEPLVERGAAGRAVQVRPPFRVDCSYVISAWSRDAHDAATGEHAILGDIMRVLLSTPSIPVKVLQGRLREHPAVLPVTSLQPGPLQSVGEMWRASGGRPKAALHYTVTIPVWTHAPEDIHIVTERILKFGVGSADPHAKPEWVEITVGRE